jgi:selenide,water dikinase
MQTELPSHEIVLLGIGHTNAHFLRMWKMRPMPDAQLTCISNYSIASYSGMLPGVLAGLYPPERMEIDLVRLCAAASARLVVACVTGLDHTQQHVMLEDRPAVPYDVLSIGIGSIPTEEGVISLDDSVLRIKPMQTLLPRLERRLSQLVADQEMPVLRIAVVGGGAGGVEIALCLKQRLQMLFGDKPTRITLIAAHDHVIAGTVRRTENLVRRALEAGSIELEMGHRVQSVRNGMVTLDNDRQLEFDLVLWATSAIAPPLLGQFDLETDDRGFLKTRPTLQTISNERIFAVGDTGTIVGSRTPKAGVYAVRQGPVLWDNIHRFIDEKPLLDYRPQRGFMRLFNTGDGQAICEYKGLSFHAKWAWRLKDAIDGRFMDKYQDYEPMPMRPADASADAALQMRCAGCGGKVGGTVLSRVLARLDIPASEHVLLGLDHPDDAAIVQPPGGRPVTLTVDFFAAPLDDPFVVGRLAALNAASDVFALGGQALAALAVATIPVGKPRQQEQLLYELLAGGLHEFRKMGATLVGGHTIEGPQLTIGYTVIADQGTPRTKSGLRIGDQLVLTKPLGTGILLAAHMLAKCRAPWMESLVASMVLSNQPAATLVDEFDIAGLTDVTGFGLGGHLLEMLKASDTACQLDVGKIPLLPGTEALFQLNIESTLAPANRAAEMEIKVSESVRKSASYAALFDPQTCGGLLIGVREESTPAVMARLAEQSDIIASVIGQVVEHQGTRRRIDIE